VYVNGLVVCIMKLCNLIFVYLPLIIVGKIIDF